MPSEMTTGSLRSLPSFFLFTFFSSWSYLIKIQEVGSLRFVTRFFLFLLWMAWILLSWGRVNYHNFKLFESLASATFGFITIVSFKPGLIFTY